MPFAGAACKRFLLRCTIFLSIFLSAVRRGQKNGGTLRRRRSLGRKRPRKQRAEAHLQAGNWRSQVRHARAISLRRTTFRLHRCTSCRSVTVCILGETRSGAGDYISEESLSYSRSGRLTYNPWLSGPSGEAGASERGPGKPARTIRQDESLSSAASTAERPSCPGYWPCRLGADSPAAPAAV
jgi:hypothetical protein